MKVLFTGAHFTPAQAVIEELKKDPGSEIVYIGRKYTQEGDNSPSIESQVLPNLGVKFIPIIAGRLRRIFDIHTIISLLKIPIGFIQSFYILVKEQPNVVLSFGGYVGVPVVFSAWLLSIPVIVHEQTLVSSLSSKFTNIFANKIALTFETDQYTNKKVVITGNPIRKELLNPASKYSEDLGIFLKEVKRNKLPLIYITGGNQGSDTINKVISKLLDKLTEKAYVIHQTGSSKANYFEKLLEQRGTLKNSERYLVKKWFDASDMAQIFRNANLVISRAGINTLLELAYFSIPTIVIPLPFLYKNEQMKNAQFFKQNGLCEIITQSNLNDESLLKLINQVLNDKNAKDRAMRAKEIVIENADKRLVQEMLILANTNA